MIYILEMKNIQYIQLKLWHNDHMNILIYILNILKLFTAINTLAETLKSRCLMRLGWLTSSYLPGPCIPCIGYGAIPDEGGGGGIPPGGMGPGGGTGGGGSTFCIAMPEINNIIVAQWRDVCYISVVGCNRNMILTGQWSQYQFTSSDRLLLADAITCKITLLRCIRHMLEMRLKLWKSIICKKQY